MAYTDYDRSQIIAQIQAAFLLFEEVDPAFLGDTTLSTVDGSLGRNPEASNTMKSIEAWLTSMGAEGLVRDLDGMDRNSPEFWEELYHGVRSQLTTNADITTKLNEWAAADPASLTPQQRAMLRAGNALHGETTTVLFPNTEARRTAELTETARASQTLVLESRAFSVEGLEDDEPLNRFQAEAAGYSLAFLRAEGLVTPELEAELNGEVDTVAEFKAIQAELRRAEAITALRTRTQGILTNPDAAGVQDIFLAQSAVAMLNPDREMVIDGDLGADGFTREQLDAGTSETFIRFREFLETTTPAVEPEPVIEPVIIPTDRPEPILTVVTTYGVDPVAARYISQYASDFGAGGFDATATDAEIRATANHGDDEITQSDIYDAIAAYRGVEITEDLLVGVQLRDLAVLQSINGELTAESVEATLRASVAQYRSQGMSEERAVFEAAKDFQTETLGVMESPDYMWDDVIRSYGMQQANPAYRMTEEQARTLIEGGYDATVEELTRTSTVLSYYTSHQTYTGLRAQAVAAGENPDDVPGDDIQFFVLVDGDIERDLRAEGRSITPELIITGSSVAAISPDATLVAAAEIPVTTIDPAVYGEAFNASNPFRFYIGDPDELEGEGKVAERTETMRSVLAHGLEDTDQISLEQAVIAMQAFRIEDFNRTELNADEQARLTALRTELGLDEGATLSINDPRLYSVLSAYANETTIAALPADWQATFTATMAPHAAAAATQLAATGEGFHLQNPFRFYLGDVSELEGDGHIAGHTQTMHAILSNGLAGTDQISLEQAALALQNFRIKDGGYTLTDDDRTRLAALRTELGLENGATISVNDPRLYGAMAAYANNTTIAELPAEWQPAFTATIEPLAVAAAAEAERAATLAANEAAALGNGFHVQNPFRFYLGDTSELESATGMSERTETMRSVLAHGLIDTDQISLEQAVLSMEAFRLEDFNRTELNEGEQARLATLRTELGLEEGATLSINDPRLYGMLAAYANDTTIAALPADWQTTFTSTMAPHAAAAAERGTTMTVNAALAVTGEGYHPNNPFRMRLGGAEDLEGDTRITERTAELRQILSLRTGATEMTFTEAALALKNHKFADVESEVLTDAEIARIAAIQTELGIEADTALSVDDPRLYTALAALSNNTTVDNLPPQWQAGFTTALEGLAASAPAVEFVSFPVVQLVEDAQAAIYGQGHHPNNPFRFYLGDASMLEGDGRVAEQTESLQRILGMSGENDEITLNQAALALQRFRAEEGIYELTEADTARLDSLRTQLGLGDTEARISVNDPRLYTALAAFVNETAPEALPAAWQTAFAAVGEPAGDDVTLEVAVLPARGIARDFDAEFAATQASVAALQLEVDGVTDRVERMFIDTMNSATAALPESLQTLQTAISAMYPAPEGLPEITIENLRNPEIFAQFETALESDGLASTALGLVEYHIDRYNSAEASLTTLREGRTAAPVIAAAQTPETLANGEFLTNIMADLEGLYLPEEGPDGSIPNRTDPMFGLVATVELISQLPDLAASEGAETALEEAHAIIQDALDYLDEQEDAADLSDLRSRLVEAKATIEGAGINAPAEQDVIVSDLRSEGTQLRMT